MTGTLHTISTAALAKALRCGQRLPMLMLGISTLLAVTPGKVVTKAQLIDWIYGDDEDGGPEWAEKNISVAVTKPRSRGVPIRTGHGGYSYEARA